MTATEQDLEVAKNQLSHVLAHHVSIYTNGMALRQVRDEREQGFLFTMSNHPGAEPLHLGRCLSYPLNTVVSDNIGEFLAIRSALKILETSPEFIEAFAIIQPMVDEVRRLEAQHQAEIETLNRTRQTLHEAEEAATAKAMAHLDRDPAIIAARKALEAITSAEPTPLIRGRQKLEAVPA